MAGAHPARRSWTAPAGTHRVVLHHSLARTSAELETANLRKAVAARDVIGQAKGILMQRRGYIADQAFDTLRHASQSLNVKLRDVAATLADRRGQP